MTYIFNYNFILDLYLLTLMVAKKIPYCKKRVAWFIVEHWLHSCKRGFLLVEWGDLPFWFFKWQTHFNAMAQGGEKTLTHTIKVQFPDINFQFHNVANFTSIAKQDWQSSWGKELRFVCQTPHGTDGHSGGRRCLEIAKWHFNAVPGPVRSNRRGGPSTDSLFWAS